MTLLNLDDTTNKFLEIINKNIFEPYLIRTDWAAIEGTPTYKDTVNATFTPTNGPILIGAGSTDYLKTKQSANETGDYFKIQQDSTNYSALITKNLNTNLDSTDVKSIDPTNLANNFNTDSDGLIYYTDAATPNVKVYDLITGTRFQDTVASGSADPTTLQNNTYYDYFVRFKVLKYIKDNYLDTKVNDLKTTTITDKLTAGANSITDLDNTLDTTGKLIINMLDFLEFINIKNNDKFEATVNCLYYYYYIALLEYNTIFCNKNLTYFSKVKVGIYNQLDKLKPTVNNYEYKKSSASDLILSSLIAIFESLIGADNKDQGTFESSLITNIFITNKNDSKVHELISKLLKLHYDASYTSAKSKSIKLLHILTSGADDSKVYQIADSVKSENVPAISAELNASYQLRLRCHINEVTSARVTAVYANIAYVDGTNTNYFLTLKQQKAIESMQVGSNIDEFIQAYNNNTDSISASIFNYFNAIADIKELYDLLTELTNLSPTGTNVYTQALVIDGNATKITSKTGATLLAADYNENNIRLLDANTKLAAIKPVLRDILEHYEKAKKLNEILGDINNAYDSIKATTKNDTTHDENNEINSTLKNITKADNYYKENVDKYKIKNNELNNIIKNNLYNNIFLYITIVVLILICLGLIYINNHTASLKTQYSVMLIAFLLLYYIIYTNVTVNITEPFETPTVLKQHKTKTEFETLSKDVHIYLYSLTTKSKAYKESLKKEKNKYDGFVKSSNSKLNSLELVLNDEFINAIKSKELVKFLILFTAICIISYIVYTNTEDPTTTSIIFIILFVIILAIYFYNINLMTRTKADNKYWNHQMVMK